MPPRRKRKLNIPTPQLEYNAEETEEVNSVKTVSDDSPPPPAKKRAANYIEDAQSISDDSLQGAKHQTRQAVNNGRQTTARKVDASEVILSDEEEIKLEEVDIPAREIDQNVEDEELEMELEEVDIHGQQGEIDHSHAYAAAYEAAAAQQETDEDGEQSQVIFKDGKGQPGGISISLSTPAKKAALAAKRSGISTKDRLTRLAVHKWLVLCLIAHTRRRNRLLNDDDLRDQLYALVPNNYLEKLRAIHPKKVPLQNERVRQFEAFLRDLTRWWSFKFHLEPNLTTGGALRQPDSDLFSTPIGKRVDGWIVESAKEREDRHRKERKAERDQEGQSSKKKKGKGKAKESIPQTSASTVDVRKPFLSEITLFKSEASTTPVFLRLATAVECIEQASDLEEQVQSMSGSRETKAQLFTSMCRALGIPARLVISIQAPSWSVAASKVASSTGVIQPEMKSKILKRKKAMKDEQNKRRQTVAKRPDDLMTSEDEGFASHLSTSGLERGEEERVERGRGRTKRSNVTVSRPMSVGSTASGKSIASTPRLSTPAATEKEAVPTTTTTKAGKKKAKEEEDYRDERWKNLEAPLEVRYEPKLRIQKPKALRPGEIGADSLSDVEPVDASAPPTMWVEVFSKPWQRWISVDPVRGLVEPMGNRQMEPSPSDKTNRLVYVVAFEEDGYARDVTARYTKTLHSRVSRMRPPPIKVGGNMIDWWTMVVKAIHRPQKLERDAIEDVELEGAAAREPMPSSVAAFKEHPVYTLEKHLKRDEVIFPPRQAGTFQGMPVFLQANVVSCRSARQWYNQGRVVKAGEEALKWVKSRGYTIANKRAEEEARMQGQDGLQEGLYALFQTQLYQAPPVTNGIVPTNSFGNIDLFVETMLPEGAAHVPYSGAVRVAKKLGIHYAEAITGFEFRKHRSMPKLTGVVVAAENEELLLSAMEEDQYMTAEKEYLKKQERLFKNWKKLLNGLKIQERLQREYGEKETAKNDNLKVQVDQMQEEPVEENDNLEAYQDIRLETEETIEAPGGGFLID